MLAITNAAYSIMLAHCQAVYPLEACGFLGGKNGTAYVVTVIENILSSSTAFEMDPQQQIEAMLAIEEDGLDLLAAYHSHPSGPSRPSPTDIAQAYYPELAQVIVSLRESSSPSARAFLLASGKVHELKLQLV